MAAGDTLRRINPNDQLILDVNGNVVGVKSPNANGSDLRFDPSSVAITGGTINSVPTVNIVAGKAVVSGLVAVSGDSRASLGGFVTALAQGASIAYHNGFFTHLTTLMGGRITAFPMTALTGQSTGHLLGTQLPQILAAKPQVVFDICDVNNFYIGGDTADIVITAKMQFWRALSEAGIICVELNSTPYGSAGSGYTAGKQAEHLKYVRWVNANFASLFPGHVLVDTYSIAANSDGTQAAGWSYDGVHPNYVYARAMAQACVTAMAGRLTFSNAISPRALSILDNVNGGVGLAKNQFSLTALAGTIGQTSLPTGWAPAFNNSSATYLLKQSPYGAGNQLQVTVTFSAAGNILILGSDSFTAGSRIRSSDIWVPSVVVDVESGQSIVSGIDVRAAVADASNTKYSFGGGAFSGDTSGVFNATNLSQEVIVGAAMSFSDTLNGGGSSVVTDAINSASVQIRVFSKGPGVVVFDITEPALWTITPAVMDLSGVVGNVTANTKAGRCSVAASATSVVVTNNRVTARSRVSATIATADATAQVKNVVCAAGSFTINLAATTGATVINWRIDD